MQSRNAFGQVGVLLLICSTAFGCTSSDSEGSRTSNESDSAEVVENIGEEVDVESQRYLAENTPSEEELASVRACVGDRSGSPLTPPPGPGEPSPVMTDEQNAVFFPCVWSLGLEDKFVAPGDHAAVEASFETAEQLTLESDCMKDLGWDVVVEEDGAGWGIESASDGDAVDVEEKLSQDLATCGVDQDVSTGFEE
jgi:hypothetical protein